MKRSQKILIVVACVLIMLGGLSCKMLNNVFGPKYGCPANGKAVGAERILNGEKVPKAKKFRS